MRSNRFLKVSCQLLPTSLPPTLHLRGDSDETLKLVDVGRHIIIVVLAHTEDSSERT